jgi:beta-glucosidase
MRVLKLKDELGLFENPYRDLDEKEAERTLLCQGHRALVREASEKSAVLLKNDGVLPFSTKVKKVAVIGDYADNGDIIGFWHCSGRADETTTLYEGVKRLLVDAKVEMANGCSMALDATDRTGFKEAVKLAKKADAVILTMGEPAGDSGEGNAKMNIEIPQIQYDLLDAILKVNKNVAVVLFSGRPLAIERLDKTAPAILHAWQPGSEGGSALANLLFGKAVPQGKLAMTFPRSTGQCPIYYNAYNTGRPRTNDKRRTYYQSSYIDGPNSPLYPFGYGLSYTKFEYSPVTLSNNEMEENGEITASVTVKNTGRITATETVQLYIRDLFGSCVRPIKELKGWQKVTLEAGEEKRVEFKINEKMLQFVHSDLSVSAEKGEFEVFIGGDSALSNGEKFNLK